MDPIPLAARLNQLAAANSQGDDDYRLLRQSLFERYSNRILIPVEESIVPVSKPSHKHLSPLSPHHVNPRDSLSSRPSSSPSSVPAPHTTTNVHSPTRLRTSVSVTSLFRRATGRKSILKDSIAAGVHTTTVNLLSASAHTPSNGNLSPKRSIIPRILHRKSSNASLAVSHPYSNSLSSPAAVGQPCNCDNDIPYASHHNGSASTPSLNSLVSRPSTSFNHQRTGSNATMTSSRAPSTRVTVKAQKSLQHNPSLSISSVGTHSSSLLSPQTPSAPSIFHNSNFSFQESLFIFDDESLSSAQDIKRAIEATESEFQRLIEEFTCLEMHTMHKARLRQARRLYVSTPKDVGVLIEGKEWREYSPLPPAPPPTIHVCSNCSGRAESNMLEAPSPGRGLKSKLKMNGKHNNSPPTASIRPSNSKLSPYVASVNSNATNGTCLSPCHWSQDPGPMSLLSPAAASSNASDAISTRSGVSSLQTHSHSNPLQLSKRPSASPTSVSTPTIPPSPMSLRRKGSLSSLSSFTISLFGGGSKHGSSIGHVVNGPGGVNVNGAATAGGPPEPISIDVVPTPTTSMGVSLGNPTTTDSGTSIRLRGSGSTGITLSRSTGNLPLSVLSELADEWEEEDDQQTPVQPEAPIPAVRDGSESGNKDDVAVMPMDRSGLGISCEVETDSMAGAGGRTRSVGGGGDTDGHEREIGSRQHHLQQHHRQESVNDFAGEHDLDHGKGIDSNSRDTQAQERGQERERPGEGASDVNDGEEEVEEIRRRKTETTEKYQARLHYLRAKLKGAELHERLMKK